MPERKIMIAGNWKMNLGPEESRELIQTVVRGAREIKGIEILVAPPFINIPVVREAKEDAEIFIAAQNMHWEKNGAFTGEISAEMLKKAGCTHVILGHSERRALFHESSEMVDRKTVAATDSELIPIVCIGETVKEREDGKTFDIIREQLEGSLKSFKKRRSIPAAAILAYEPVWAIGTGLTASPEQAQEIHRFIRNWLKDEFGQKSADLIRILYGGSVKPDNASDLMAMPDIDGALVGGASLKADSFLGIISF